jgi:hypothetical protein
MRRLKRGIAGAAFLPFAVGASLAVAVFGWGTAAWAGPSTSAELFARRGPAWPRNWTTRLLGVIVVVFGVLLATGTITIS